MEGGKKGLIENSKPLCSPHAPKQMTVMLTDQNGKRYDSRPKVRTSCPRHKHAKPRPHRP
jgi:hypothetical protein